MKYVRRFMKAWKYFMIVWKNDGNVTGKMLSQLKRDNVIEAHTMDFIYRKYFNAKHIEASYNPDGETYKITMRMEDF